MSVALTQSLPAAATAGGDLTLEALEPRIVGALASDALRIEAELTPKPGLVDRRGRGAHSDMHTSRPCAPDWWWCL